MPSDRFISPVALPTPYQAEIAGCLAEECAEVTQRAMKLFRFGCADVQANHALNNVERLSDEVGDLLEVLDWAYGAGIIDMKRAIAHKPSKRDKLLKYLQHQPTERELLALRLHASGEIPIRPSRMKIFANAFTEFLGVSLKTRRKWKLAQKET